MAESYVKLVKQLSGTVQSVPTVIGVATNDYEVLENKPTINGVMLSGDVALEQLGIDLTGILSANARALLIAILRSGVYASEQSTNITALAAALNVTEKVPEVPAEPQKTMTGIAAVYSGGAVEAGTDVNALTGITVAVLYSDGSRKTVTGYTLSGAIAEGNNIITVSYGGFTDTIMVTGDVQGGSGGPVNLFDKETMVTTGAFVNTGGAVSSNAGGAYATIPITGGKSYAMQRKVLSFGNGSAGNITLLDEGRNVIYRWVLGAANITGEGYNIAYVNHTETDSNPSGLKLRTDDNYKGITFETATNCAYLQLTVRFNGSDGIDTFMVEEGTACSEYAAYA